MTAETQRAWLAGFFDGEGSLSLPVLKKTGCIFSVLTMCNTDRQNADAMKEVASAIIGREIRFQMRNVGWKPLYVIYVHKSSEQQALLEAILPYLRGKKPQAMLFLEYLRVRPGKGNRYEAFHYEYPLRLRRMNKRYKKGTWQETNSQRETERLAPREGEETARTAWQHAEVDRNAQPA